jgi:hypothetical protein
MTLRKFAGLGALLSIVMPGLALAETKLPQSSTPAIPPGC